MNGQALQTFLLDLINSAPKEGEGVAQATVVFKTGQSIQGAVRVKMPAAVDTGGAVLFEIVAAMATDKNATQPNVLVSFFFTAESLERIVMSRPIEQPRIQPVTAGGLIIPS